MIDCTEQPSTDTGGRVRVTVGKRCADLHVVVKNIETTLKGGRQKCDPALTSLLERLRLVLGEHVTVELEQAAPNEVTCDVGIPHPAGTAKITERLRRLFEEELRDGEPTRARVAARLHMSARTLHRRLVGEGTTFRRILTDTRRELAEGHLRERRLSIAEIGFLLGFSEPSAFHRAFKRWTGWPPHAYRRCHTDDAGGSAPRQRERLQRG